MMVYLAACEKIKGAFSAGLASPDQSSQQIALKALHDAFPDAGVQMQLQAQQPGGGVTLLDGTLHEADRVTLDDSLRQFAVQLAQQAASHGVPFMQLDLASGGPPSIARFLDTAYWMSSVVVRLAQAKGGPAAPPIRLVEIASYCKLIEDLLELGTIRDNMGVFMHIEHQMVELMSKEVGTASPARLCILRSCNNLLRRLSKSQDLQLCGRILVFIARIYPLGDKSGVNLQGTVNSGLSLPIDEVTPGDKDSNGEPIDAKLYTTFWGLQNVFKNPQSILQQSVWAKTVQDMSLVLEEMDRRKVTVKAGYSFSQPQTQQGLEGVSGAADASTTSTVKYLSSSKLFGLQMRDASFRRQFLVQCAALLHCTQKPGKLAEKVASSSSNFEGAQELSNRVFAAMVRTEECGADFAKAVRHILKHEDEWVDWKSAGCPAFDKPPAPSLPADLQSTLAASLMGNVMGYEGLERLAASKKPQQQQQPQPQQQAGGPGPKRRRVGPAGVRLGGPAQSLMRHISVPEDQMAGLAAAERKLLPDIQEFVHPVLEGMDPESGIDEDYRALYTDKVYAWKVVRMMSRSHLSQLSAFKGGATDTPKNIEDAMLNIFPDKRAQFDSYRQQQKEQQAAAEEAEAAEAAAANGAAGGHEGAEAGTQQQEQQHQQEGQQGTHALEGGAVADGGNGEGGASGGQHQAGVKVEEGGGKHGGVGQGGEGPSEMEGVETREGA